VGEVDLISDPLQTQIYHDFYLSEVEDMSCICWKRRVGEMDLISDPNQTNVYHDLYLAEGEEWVKCT
jgi:hypothetical protein